MNESMRRVHAWARNRRGLERWLAGLGAVSLLVVVVAAGAVLALFALAVACVIGLAAACMYLFARAFGGRRRAQQRGTSVLVARKGPRGWTVDAA